MIGFLLFKITACFTNFTSYNMRGFQQGQYLVKDLCETQDVIALQEHWLSDSNLHPLINIHSDFTVIAKQRECNVIYYVEDTLVV